METCELTDMELWGRVRQDDGAAFRQLFDRYWERLYVYALNRIKSEADAQDVVQDVMVRVWTRRASITIETTLAAYLHAAVQYETIAQVARAAKTAGRNSELEQSILPDITAFSDPLRYKELQALAQQEIARLPEKMRQVYRLRQEEHYSVKEIAGMLGVSEQTVRNQLNTSYQKLRKQLREAILSAIFLW